LLFPYRHGWCLYWLKCYRFWFVAESPLPMTIRLTNRTVGLTLTQAFVSCYITLNVIDIVVE
jgi:hypothetical protein